MIFSELTLHNFGVYKGRQVFDLEPESKKPIILVGALNGSGKTTFLNAIQLALYGKISPAASQSRGGYSEFLRGSVNRNVPGSEGASVELTFRMTSEGRERTFHVRRSWHETKSNRLSENFEVTVDGKLDKVLTDQWLDYVEDVLPARIMPLFFFDGEKIEELASEEHSAEILSTAISGLLGLDIVDRLNADLKVYERRKKALLYTPERQKEIKAAQKTLDEAETQLKLAQEVEASINTRRDRAEHDVAKTRKEYAAEGGVLYEQREEIEREMSVAHEQRMELQTRMSELAGEYAPLLLIQDLLEAVAVQADAEAVSKQAESVLEILTIRDHKLLDLLNEEKAGENTVKKASAFLEKNRTQFHGKATSPRHINMTEAGQRTLHAVLAVHLDATKEQVKSLLGENTGVESHLDVIERKLAAIPTNDAIEPFVERLEKAQSKLAELKSEALSHEHDLKLAERTVEVAKNDLKKLFETEVEERFKADDAVRSIKHSSKAQDTILRFRRMVIESQIGKISSLIRECFEKLSRKNNLISSVEISPDNFQITLKDGASNTIHSDDLSAGERQLLAVSILWALSKASGRSIPTIVDTPLGRLDSKHRTNLVEGYFPFASDQVILLSTDEEIDEKYLKLIKPNVCKSYCIEFNEEIGGSQVRPGYLM